MENASKKFNFRTAAHFVRPIPFKAHRIEGFSPETLERHYEEIYGGAIRRLNLVELRLAELSGMDQRESTYAELKAEERRLANAIALHEIHFDGLGEDGGEALDDPGLRAEFDSTFGGIEAWWDDVMALVESWPNGVGWIVLAWSQFLGRLINVSLTSDQGLIDAKPIFALDMSDYAFAADFGDDRRAYAGTVFKSLHWNRISARFNAGVVNAKQADTDQISVRDLKAIIENGEEPVLVLDVRHDDDRERYTSRIMETEWRDSFNVAAWADTCPKDSTIVVYCMYGFWVSQKVAEELRERGFDARSLEGGIAAWRAMELPSSEIAD